jgi:threonylcarbamoyladenosine tRNA methylthiotransferase MtaB
MLPRTYRVVTLGCKLNQFDSASIEGQLRARGFHEAEGGETAGVYVVNTCTVTKNADREARQLARRGRRENPGCRLLVTGCYAERDREGLARTAEIDEIVGHSDRERIPAILDRIAAEAAPPEARSIACVEAAGGAAPGAADLLHFGDHTRAFLKIQEGCDLSCSYCIIPKVRGASRSIAPELLEEAVLALTARGYREIVLTGVNTGDYGRDLTPRTTLAALLARLLRTPCLGRLRLNSLEPRTVTREIVDLLADEGGLARHLQVPLQSGCDATLKRMYRNYRTSDYRTTVETLRARLPGIGLGADVIVGFPGESDEEFEETYRFIASSPLNYLHVFSYSDRPGTPASGHSGHVRPEEVRERSARLRALGDDLGLRFRRGFVGSVLEVLPFAVRRADGRLRALSGNFIEVALHADDSVAHRLIPVRIDHADEADTLASLIPATDFSGSSTMPIQTEFLMPEPHQGLARH